MGVILDAITRFFQEDEWPFAPLEGRTVLRTGFQSDNGQWTCYAQAREEQEQFVFYSICPVKAPEKQRMPIAEFLTRANYGMIIGNFELDLNDGEIRYKTSIDVKGDELSQPLISHLVYANVLTMNRYLPGIMKVLYAGAAPAEAVAEIEGAG